MSSINQLLLKLREAKGLSLREAAKRSGLSHSYIDSLEKGVHPKTKAPIKPSPDSLKSLAAAYDYDYILLMNAADYVEEEPKSSEYKQLPESEIERIIREAELHYDVNLRDDPDVNNALRELIHSLAKMKKK
ncbi:helix-turn-helix domain-containing protein [Paenibacillus urinalis]|uniref:helix-turn-helix domain-containing protein n=1 Tax=Paenibacillus urinalis TaxID=521520 RepID=UPI001961A377